MANATVTVKASGGDYTTLNAALAGEAADLTANCHSTGGAGILTIECYAMEDTTAASTGTGYTTSASYYINITVPVAERHDGKWNTNKYRLYIASGYAWIGILTCTANYTRITGIQIKYSGTNAYCGCFYTNGTEIRVDSCFGHITDSSAGSVSCHVYYIVSDDESQSLVTNCIGILARTTGSNPASVFLGSTTTNPGHKFYNNTAIGGRAGFNAAWGDYRNCLASGFGAYGFYEYCNASSDYNASEDTTAPGSNSRDSQTFTFIDDDNGDYHLASTDSGARDYGTSLASIFTTDIDGETRSGTWDIGADEYVAAGGASSTPSSTLARGIAVGMFKGMGVGSGQYP